MAARLAGVDAQIGLMMTKLKATEQLATTVTELARTVTELKAELKESKNVHQQQIGSLKEAAGAFERAAAMLEQAGQRQVLPVQSWAEKVTGSRRQSRVRTLQSAGRERSVSSKRKVMRIWSKMPLKSQELKLTQSCAMQGQQDQVIQHL